MSDLSISLLFLPLSALLLLVYLHNRVQARSLIQMAASLEDLYLLEIKNRRSRIKSNLSSLDAPAWLASCAGGQVNLESCLGHSSSPAWLNLRIVSGGRLVVSPLSPSALKNALPNRGIRSRLGKAFEPLLGHAPGGIKVSCRSLAEQEFFDLEAAEVGRQLGSNWGEVTRLWFYLVPAPRQA